MTIADKATGGYIRTSLRAMEHALLNVISGSFIDFERLESQYRTATYEYFVSEVRYWLKF